MTMPLTGLGHLEKNICLHGGQLFDVLPRRVLGSSLAKEERVARVERAKKQSLVARKMGREQSKKNRQFVLFAQDQFTQPECGKSYSFCKGF